MLTLLRANESSTMRVKLVSIFTALTVALIAVRAEGDQQRLEVTGQLAVADGTRSTTLRVLCEPDPHGGALSLELWVPDAASRKDFDYADFEGPDAAARDRILTRLSVTGGDVFVMGAKAGGWYAGNEPNTFVFAVTQPSHQPGAVSSLIDALDARDITLVWVQTAMDDAQRTLRATFTLDATLAQRMRDTAAPCLPPRTSSPSSHPK